MSWLSQGLSDIGLGGLWRAVQLFYRAECQTSTEQTGGAIMTKKTTKQSPVFSAIEAHRRTLRQSRRASRACEVIKKKFPKLAPRDVRIWEKILKVDDPRREAWERDQSIHKKARQMADVRRAEIVRYEAYMEASAKLRELCNLRTVDLNEAAAITCFKISKAKLAISTMGNTPAKRRRNCKKRTGADL
jgi:hypothetical protein